MSIETIQCKACGGEMFTHHEQERGICRQCDPDQLKEQVKVVAKARRVKQEAIETYDEAFRRWCFENEDRIQAVAQAREKAAAAEVTLREMALDYYKNTGNKHPVSGVGIRIMQRLSYDKELALSWAKQHGLALQLDTTTFEKMARVTPPAFIEIIHEPQATIATDLETVVGNEGEG